MMGTCKKIKKQEVKELGLVLIDYLQLMDGPISEFRDHELSRITRQLKTMAYEIEVPIMLLFQLNRRIESRYNKRLMLSDIPELGAIENNADLVVMIYRDEYYNADTCDRGITELITCKHRNGPVATVKLLFEPEYTLFRNLAVA